MSESRAVRLGVVLLTAVLLWVAALSLLAIAPAVRAEASLLFVKPGGSGTACTQAAPCTLSTALGKAVDGDTVYLGAGTYTGVGSGAVATVTHSIDLLGGWNGAATGPVLRNSVAYSSTIDGQNQRRGLYLGSSITVGLDSLVVTRGRAVGQGAGLYARGSNVNLFWMQFLTNHVTDTNYSYGGGAYVEGGAVRVIESTFWHNSSHSQNFPEGGGLAISGTTGAEVTGCIFEGNDAWSASGLLVKTSWGDSRCQLEGNTFSRNGRGDSKGSGGGYYGAVYAQCATITVRGNTLHDNWAANRDGALSADAHNLTVSGNRISGNQCRWDDAISLYASQRLTITNNLIFDNLSEQPAPCLRIWRGSGLVAHNTLARNTGGCGIFFGEGVRVWLTNNILVSHTMGISLHIGSLVTSTGNLWGAGVWANGADSGGAGTLVNGPANVRGNPNFVDPANNNYRITSLSAARDAGVPNGVVADIEGKPRPWGAGWDMGAYEYRPSGEYRSIYLPAVVRLR